MVEDAIHTAIEAAMRPLMERLLDAIDAAKAEILATLPPRILSLKAAAKERGISEKTLHRRIKAGEVRAERDGRRILVDMNQFKGEGRRVLGDVDAAALARRVRTGTK